MNLAAVLDIVDRATAWAWIQRTHLPDGVQCPVCGAMVDGELALKAFRSLKRTYCRSHNGAFRPQAAVAVLRGTEWAPEEYVKFLLMHHAGRTDADIAALLGKSSGCVRDMSARVACLAQTSPLDADVLDGKG